MTEADLVRAAWDGRVEVLRYPISKPCQCGHEMVAHMQGCGRCCVSGCSCSYARPDYAPRHHEIARVHP